MVLWWVPAGHIPSIEEAAQKLNTLKAFGPTTEAFVFKKAFPAPLIEVCEFSDTVASRKRSADEHH